MDKQEYTEGHAAQAMDRVSVVIGLIEDILTDHPGIEKTGQSEKILKAAEFLMDAYQDIGAYILMDKGE